MGFARPIILGVINKLKKTGDDAGKQ